MADDDKDGTEEKNAAERKNAREREAQAAKRAKNIKEGKNSKGNPRSPRGKPKTLAFGWTVVCRGYRTLLPTSKCHAHPHNRGTCTQMGAVAALTYGLAAVPYLSMLAWDCGTPTKDDNR